MTLRGFLLGGLAALALTGAAAAADIPVRGPIYAKAPSAFSWDGWYVGVHGGYAWGDFDSTYVGVGSDNLKPDGGFGGVQIGYLHHLTPSWVLGFEVDFSAADVSGTGFVAAPARLDIDFFGSARTRLGYAAGPWLIYGTGGVAWAKTDFNIGAGVAVSDHPHVGWTVGAGIEYAFAPNWSAKIEYLYADLDNTRSSVAIVAVDQRHDLTLSTVRLGVNYRFGDVRAPVYAAYPTKGPVAVPFTWTGVYVGVHAGYGFGEQDLSSVGVVFAASLEPSGAFGGFQSGANWQFASNWVIGIETDSSFGSLDDRISVAGGSVVETDSFGTVRGRLGYAVNRLLFYGTGGIAWAHNESSYGGGAYQFDRFHLGWAAGAGIEYAISPRWSAKLEYLHMDLGDNTNRFGALVINEGLTLDTVRIGLNYRASLFDLFTGR